MWHHGLRYKLLNLNLPLSSPGGFQTFLRIGWCRIISWVPHPGTSPSSTVYHKVIPLAQSSTSSSHTIYLYLMVFRLIFADDLKYFVTGPNLSIITTKLQQSMNDLAVYANQWRIGLNAGKTSKLLFQRSTRYLPDWHITLHGRAIRSVTAKFLGITFDTTLSFTKHFHAITNLARHRLLKLVSIYTSTHGTSPSTTIRLFNTYIRTLRVR